jgi:hypothetical protein
MAVRAVSIPPYPTSEAGGDPDSQKREGWGTRAFVAVRKIEGWCVMLADAPREQVVRFPPLLCIEILSPEDTLSRMVERVHDFLKMGVRQVWIFDPRLRSAMVCEGSAMVEHTAGQLALPGTQVTVDLAEVFRVLDEV